MTQKSKITRHELKDLKIKVAVRLLLVLVFFGILTLLPAGTFHYWQVYVYSAFLFIPLLFVVLYFFKHDPRFLERRIRTKEKEKAQRIIQIVSSLLFYTAFVICGFDKRFGWSDIPFSIVLLADFVSLSGYVIIFFVFKENSYASRVVEVEKSQKIVTTGLYSVVRHPMYFGVLIMWMPIPIALGSFWGLIPMANIPIALVLRILNEESVLKKELPGYLEYCQKTKYRLIPFIW